jgi:hypothetical protein
MFKNVMQSLGLGWILLNDLSNGIQMWKVAHEMEFLYRAGSLRRVEKELAKYSIC